MVELEADDLIQASEKFWGSAAQAIKCLAESRGWRHNSHIQFYNIMATLEREATSSKLHYAFDAASQLHTNFYENWQDEDQIRRRAGSVLDFCRATEQLGLRPHTWL